MQSPPIFGLLLHVLSAWSQAGGAETAKDEGLIADWPFTSAEQGLVRDASGHGNDARLSGQALVRSTPAGGGLVELHLNTGSLSAPGIAGEMPDFSVSFWFNPFSVDNHINGIGAQRGWNTFNFHTAPLGAVYVGTSFSRFTTVDLPYGTVATGTWQMLTYTYRRDCTARFYKNGTLLAERIVERGLPWDGFRLGNDVDALVGRTRIHKRELDAAEVKALYDSDREGYAMPRAELVMDHASGGYVRRGAGIALDYTQFNLAAAQRLALSIVDVDGAEQPLPVREVPPGGTGRHSSRVMITAPERCGIYWLKARVECGAEVLLQSEIPFATTIELPDLKDVAPEASPLGICYRDESQWVGSRFLGIKWNRLLTPFIIWAETEPQDGHFRWEVYDRKIALAAAAGDAVMVCLGSAPPAWAVDQPKPANLGSLAWLPRDMSTWRRWVREIASRSRGKVQAYDIWNEPLRSWNTSGRHSGRDYFELLKAACEEIRAADPRALVVGINDHPDSHIRLPDGSDDRAGIEAVFKLGAAAHMDVFGIHDYNMDAPTAYAHRTRNTLRMKELAQTYGKGRLPMWDCETSFTSPPRVAGRPINEAEYQRIYGGQFNPGGGRCFNGPGGIIDVPERRSASWEVQATLLSFAHGSERRFIFAEMADTVLPTEKGVAIAALARFVGDLRQWSGIAEIDVGPQAGGVRLTRRDGTSCAVLWSTPPAATVGVVLVSAGDVASAASDFLGNRLPRVESRKGVLRLALGNEPLYLDAVPADLHGVQFARLAEGDLEIDPEAGSTPEIKLTLLNPLAEEGRYRIRLGLPAGLGSSAIPAEFRVPPGQELSVPIRFTVDPAMAAGATRLTVTVERDFADGAMDVALAEKGVFVKRSKPLTAAVAGLTVDGDPADWAAIPWSGEARDYAQVVIGRRKTGLTEGVYAHWEGPEDLSFRCKTAWDRERLLLLIDVTDGKEQPLTSPGVELDKGDHPWDYDCVEIFLALPGTGESIGGSATGLRNSGQILVVPPAGAQPEDCAVAATNRNFNQADKVACRFLGRRTATGYVIEGSISPQREFALKPGALILLDIGVDDRSEAWKARKSQILLNGISDGNCFRPFEWATYRLDGPAGR